MLKIRKIAIIAIATLAISSCQKQIQKTLTPESAQENASILSLKDVKVENGMLKFENEVHLMNCKNELMKMSSEEITSWQKSIGFKSVMSIMNDAQLEMKQISEKYPDNDVNAKSYYYFVDEIKPIAVKYKKYMDIDENGNVTKMNIYDNSTAWFSNEKQVIKVGKMLEYYSYDKFIIILDGNMNKMLNTINNPIEDKNNSIIVCNIKHTDAMKSRGGTFDGSISTGNTIVIKSLGGSTSPANSSQARSNFELDLASVYSSNSSDGVHNFSYSNYTLKYQGWNQRRAFIGWQARYVTTDITGNFYSHSPTSAQINFYYSSFMTPFPPYPTTTPYVVSRTENGNSSSYGYDLKTGIALLGTTGVVYSGTYNITESFKCVPHHINGIFMEINL